MSGALQAIFQNHRSFTIPLPADIGAAFGGGFFAGQISTSGNGTADYNLVVGPVASAQNTSLQFKIIDSGADPTSVIDGPNNSSTMNSATYPAAQFCEGLTIGGFSDWYLPAVNELEVCYYNLKPSTTSNSTSFGINPNAVPPRASNYTTSDPAQTSALNFRITSGAQAFATDEYWSSTQHAGYSAKARYFGAGSGGNRYKTSNRHVRAIRRVAV